MAGLSLRCDDCGVLLRSVEEAHAHAEATSHTNFSESTEAVLNFICADCGKPCRSQIEVDLHTKVTGHAEYMEAAKPIDLEAPLKPASEAMDVDASGSGEPQEMVAPEVNKEMLANLESMGFSTGSATRALHFGNSTIECAINWICDHHEDPDIDEMPMVLANSNTEANKPSLVPEEEKIKARELRERARKKEEEKEKRRMVREMEKQVKKSIVRISFDWNPPMEEPRKMFISLPGLILSKDDSSCFMLADGTFLIEEKKLISNVKLQLPNAQGYAAELTENDYNMISTPQLVKRFCVFKINQSNDFIEPLLLETTRPKEFDTVHAYCFGRENHTPLNPSIGYSPGRVGFSHEDVVFTGIPFHEFGHFGAPVFNHKGHLVAICYANQSSSHAWSVKSIKELLFNVKSDIGNITYLRDGPPTPPEH